jgi:hypothetical protein
MVINSFGGFEVEVIARYERLISHARMYGNGKPDGWLAADHGWQF